MKMDLLEIRVNDTRQQRHAESSAAAARTCAHKFEVSTAGCSCLLCGIVRVGVLDDQHASYQQQQFAYDTMRGGRRRRISPSHELSTIFFEACAKLKLNLQAEMLQESQRRFQVLTNDETLKPVGISCVAMCTGKNSVAMVAVIIMLVCRAANVKLDEHTLVHHTLKRCGIRLKFVSRCFILCRTWDHFNISKAGPTVTQHCL